MIQDKEVAQHVRWKAFESIALFVDYLSKVKMKHHQRSNLFSGSRIFRSFLPLFPVFTCFTYQVLEGSQRSTLCGRMWMHLYAEKWQSMTCHSYFSIDMTNHYRRDTVQSWIFYYEIVWIHVAPQASEPPQDKFCSMPKNQISSWYKTFQRSTSAWNQDNVCLNLVKMPSKITPQISQQCLQVADARYRLINTTLMSKTRGE